MQEVNFMNGSYFINSQIFAMQVTGKKWLSFVWNLIFKLLKKNITGTKLHRKARNTKII